MALKKNLVMERIEKSIDRVYAKVECISERVTELKICITRLEEHSSVHKEQLIKLNGQVAINTGWRFKVMGAAGIISSVVALVVFVIVG